VKLDGICSLGGGRQNNEKREKREGTTNNHEFKMELVVACAWMAVKGDDQI
jgi:hypothetical protein